MRTPEKRYRSRCSGWGRLRLWNCSSAPSWRGSTCSSATMACRSSTTVWPLWVSTRARVPRDLWWTEGCLNPWLNKSTLSGLANQRPQHYLQGRDDGMVFLKATFFSLTLVTLRQKRQSVDLLKSSRKAAMIDSRSQCSKHATRTQWSCSWKWRMYSQSATESFFSMNA